MSIPLTKENLARVASDDEGSSLLMERYYQGSPRSKSIMSTTTTTDTVMPSPRLLPFPYHNDSTFLPTAEHHHRCSSPYQSWAVAASTRRASSVSAECPPPRRPSLASPRRQTSSPHPLSFQQRHRMSRKQKSDSKRNWLRRLWKLFTLRKRKSVSMERSPVWYTQFKANPPPPPGLATAIAA